MSDFVARAALAIGLGERDACLLTVAGGGSGRPISIPVTLLARTAANGSSLDPATSNLRGISARSLPPPSAAAATGGKSPYANLVRTKPCR